MGYWVSYVFLAQGMPVQLFWKMLAYHGVILGCLAVFYLIHDLTFGGRKPLRSFVSCNPEEYLSLPHIALFGGFVYFAMGRDLSATTALSCNILAIASVYLSVLSFTRRRSYLSWTVERICFPLAPLEVFRISGGFV